MAIVIDFVLLFCVSKQEKVATIKNVEKAVVFLDLSFDCYCVSVLRAV
jgi:hypothetical protein